VLRACRPGGDHIAMDEGEQAAGPQPRTRPAGGVGIEWPEFQLAARIRGFVSKGRHDAQCATSV